MNSESNSAGTVAVSSKGASRYRSSWMGMNVDFIRPAQEIFVPVPTTLSVLRPAESGPEIVTTKRTSLLDLFVDEWIDHVQPETKFKNRVLSDLAKLGRCYAIKTQERARKGVPDLLLCYRGLFLAIELKDTGFVPTPLQDYVGKQILKADGIYFFATPESWEAQYEALKEFRLRL